MIKRSPLHTKYLDILHDLHDCPLIDITIEEKITGWGTRYLSIILVEKDRRSCWQRFFGPVYYERHLPIHMHDRGTIYITLDYYSADLRKFIVDLSYKYSQFEWKDGSL